MISKGILHHLAKFQINLPSFTVIEGNFQKLEQDENFLEQVNNYISSKQLYFYFWHTTFQSKYIG